MQYNEIHSKADQATDLLKALANRNRLMILCVLTEGEKSVGALAKTLGIRETVVSQHLALLRKDGLVQPRRDAQTIHYSLAGSEARRVIETLYEIYCAPVRQAKEAGRGAAVAQATPSKSRPTSNARRQSKD